MSSLADATEIGALQHAMERARSPSAIELALQIPEADAVCMDLCGHTDVREDSCICISWADAFVFLCCRSRQQPLLPKNGISRPGLRESCSGRERRGKASTSYQR